MTKTAVVHDWLPVFSGAEQVLTEMLTTLGPVDLYTLFDLLTSEDRGRLGPVRITQSYLAKLPGLSRYYRWTFPLCPGAIESFDLSDYDLVVSSSAAFAKGVLVHPHQKHVAYVHTPIRYAWDQTFEYLATTPLTAFPTGPLLNRALHRLRLWDARTAHGPDLMVANSNVVKRRIEQIYGRKSLVVHPPVSLSKFPVCRDKDGYFLVASRLVPYKRLDLVVRAFAEMRHHRLVVAGDGPQMSQLRALATPNVEFKGHVSHPDLVELMQHAQAFVFAGCEDFGIVMAEAQAAGTPLIAYRRGGAEDIVVPLGHADPTGILFDRQDSACVVDAVTQFIEHRAEFTPDACRRNAENFSTEMFRKKFQVVAAWMTDSSFRRDTWPDELDANPVTRSRPAVRAIRSVM